MKRQLMREFPGNPVVRTLCFHCRVPGLRSLVREDSPCGQKKKKTTHRMRKYLQSISMTKDLCLESTKSSYNSTIKRQILTKTGQGIWIDILQRSTTGQSVHKKTHNFISHHRNANQITMRHFTPTMCMCILSHSVLSDSVGPHGL